MAVTLTAVLSVGLCGRSDAKALRINEVLANPTEAVGAEWVELVNESDTAVNLFGWKLGDALREVTITSGGVVVPPNGYIVLVQDSAAFRSFYADQSLLVVEPGSWPALNNTGDTVRLIDPAGLEADRFGYAAVFSANMTWSRNPSDPSGWGQSRSEGGTPGAANELRPVFTGDGLRVLVSPRVFSPDGDGVEDSTAIEIRGDSDDRYTVRVYDREGRKVWEYEVVAGRWEERYVWRGESQSGERLPVGIYIVHVESGNGDEAVETVVIAR